MRLIQMNHEPGKSSAYARAAAWCAGALGLLAAGVFAGAMAGKEWKWIFPVAGFGAYLFAFRRGLQVANPKGLDLVWRLSALAGPRKPRASRPHADRAGASRNGKIGGGNAAGGPIHGGAGNQG